MTKSNRVIADKPVQSPRIGNLNNIIMLIVKEGNTIHIYEIFKINSEIKIKLLSYFDSYGKIPNFPNELPISTIRFNML